MAKTKNFNILREKLYAKSDPADLERARRETRAYIALGKAREQMERTQVEVAAALGTSQANVSKVEHSADLKVSTIYDYVRALGGELRIAAVFPEGTVMLLGDGVDES